MEDYKAILHKAGLKRRTPVRLKHRESYERLHDTNDKNHVLYYAVTAHVAVFGPNKGKQMLLDFCNRCLTLRGGHKELHLDALRAALQVWTWPDFVEKSIKEIKAVV